MASNQEKKQKKSRNPFYKQLFWGRSQYYTHLQVQVQTESDILCECVQFFFFCLSKNIVNYYLQLIFLCTVHTHKDARSTHLASDKNSFHLSAWTAGFLITTAWQAVWKKGILHITQVIINTHARKQIHMYKNTYKSKKCMNTVETLWIVLP